MGGMDNTETAKTALREAIDLLGGTTALARQLGFARPNPVSNWFERGVPLEQCVRLEKITGLAGRRILCERLRPDMAEYFRYLRTPA